MRYVLFICLFVSAIASMLMCCNEKECDFSFKNKGKERLSEREDFSDFPRAGDLYVNFDLSKSEVWSISYPGAIQVYPDFKSIRKILVHTYHPIQDLKEFHSKKIYLSITQTQKIDLAFLTEVNPVLRMHGFPEIRKQDISFYWHGCYRVICTDDFWYGIDGVTLRSGISFILFTKIPKAVL